MRSEFEKEALKEVILSNKKDIIKNIENSLNSNPTKKEKIDLENLLIRLEGASIPCIFSNLDNDIIDSYVVDMIEGKVYRCRLYDFFFE